MLSGGQYDKLMERMGKHCGAMGFALYLNELERLDPVQTDFDVDLLLRYDDATDLTALTRTLAEQTAAGKQVLVRRDPTGVRARETMDLRGGEEA